MQKAQISPRSNMNEMFPVVFQHLLSPQAASELQNMSSACRTKNPEKNPMHAESSDLLPSFDAGGTGLSACSVVKHLHFVC